MYFYDFFDLLELLIIPLVLWFVIAPIYLFIKTHRLEQEIKSLRQHLASNTEVGPSHTSSDVLPAKELQPVSMYDNNARPAHLNGVLPPIPAPVHPPS